MPSSAERSQLRAHFDAYLDIGGFPEAGAFSAARDRAASISSPAVFEREVQALVEARQEFPDAEALLVTETDPPREARAPQGVKIVPIWQWLLAH